MTNPQISHKNKTVAACLATVGGGIGLYRFYLAGRQDKWGWLHAVSVPLSACIYFSVPGAHLLIGLLPLILSVLAGFLACLIIGTTSDEKWDATYNANSGKQSHSGWPIALLLVFSLALGAGSLIFVIARSFDLFFTGGSYG